jgi:uncharacterized protein (DUF4415 family)
MAESKRVTYTDLARLDAHEVQPEEYEDIPELTDDDFDRAEFRIGDRVIRRGRPPLDHPKKQVTLRLDQEVIEHFRKSGPGWQSRINEALRAHIAGK